MTLPIVVMGVSGSGKSTLARLLADALGWRFVEGDTLHPAANVAKMARGEPLTDEDRLPFLDNVGHALGEGGARVVASCSALKRIYRNRLRSIAGEIVFVFPMIARAELEQRMASRTDHFMPPSLLDSQLATLEPPEVDEMALTIDGMAAPEQQLAEILDRLPVAR